MTLNLCFCEAMECDQVRVSDEDFTTCNLCDQLVYGMDLEACPKIQQLLAKTHTEGRQEAAAELDRSAGQPMQTYIQKQSIIKLLVSLYSIYNQAGLKYKEDKESRKATQNYAAKRAINKLVNQVIYGDSTLIEVEL